MRRLQEIKQIIGKDKEGKEGEGDIVLGNSSDESKDKLSKEEEEVLEE